MTQSVAAVSDLTVECLFNLVPGGDQTVGGWDTLLHLLLCEDV